MVDGVKEHSAPEPQRDLASSLVVPEKMAESRFWTTQSMPTFQSRSAQGFSFAEQALKASAASKTMLGFDRDALLAGLAGALKADPALASQIEGALKLTAGAR